MPTLLVLAFLLCAPDEPPAGAGPADLLQAVRSADFAAVDAISSLLRNGNSGATVDFAALERELANPNPAVRRLAAYVLSELDRDRAGHALPALIEALQDHEPRVRARIALALAQIGPAAHDALPALTRQLTDPEPRARAGAARALVAVGAEPSTAVPLLVGLLHDREPPVRAIAAIALGQFGAAARETVPALRAVQRDDVEPDVRAAAENALEEIDPSLAALVAALSNADANRRLWAVSGLIEKSDAARDAVPALTGVLQLDADAKVRAGAALALGKIGRDARSAGPVLIERLHDPVARVRVGAALALGLIGPTVEGSAAPLADALADEDSTVATEAATALGNLGPTAAAAAPVLVAFLKENDVVRRRRAVNVLARIGPGARAALPALLDALGDRDAAIRRDACRALVSVGPQATARLSALQEALHCRETPTDAPLRAWACLSLAAIGPPALEALPALLDALDDEDAAVRNSAVLALGKLGPEAVPALVKGLDHLGPHVRAGSACALGVQGLGARRALNPLMQALRDEDANVRLAAAASLGRIATALQLQQETRDLPALREALTALDGAVPPVPGSAEEAPWQTAHRQVRDAVAALATAERSYLLDRLMQSPWAVALAGLALYAVGMLLLWSAVLRLRPLGLLRLGDLLSALPRLPLPVGSITLQLSVRHLLLLHIFQYRPRVLDAWVANCRDSVRRHFEQKRAVFLPRIYEPLPVALDGQILTEPAPRQLGAAFASQRGCLLIHGEAGAGKSDLACRLALAAMTDAAADRPCEHVMLPVLLEHDLDLSAGFVETVRGQLQAVVGDAHPVSPELLDALLRCRRLLLIVDGLSEFSEASREALRPGQADFPVHALVVTSRREEPLDGVPHSVARPLRAA